MLKKFTLVVLVLWVVGGHALAADELADGFLAPPNEAKPRVYWWWLNSQVTNDAITRNLEEMQAKGIGGALLFDAGGGAGPVPAGPAFMSDSWRELFRHAVREAGRLGLELSVNLCSGWDCGGPWIDPEHGCRRFAKRERIVSGPKRFAELVPPPTGKDCRDVAVLAIPLREGQRTVPTPRVIASSSQRQYPAENVVDRFFHHTFTCSPQEFGKPGLEYFAGTHFNPNVTWWEQAGTLEQYIARCQYLLSRGLFVADVCYYNGDQVPNFVGPKHAGLQLGPGYDYDVCNADVLLHRLQVRRGRVVLPDGMGYRLLVLPERETMPPAVLEKIGQLVAAGATVVGPKPKRAPGLRDFPRCDTEVGRLADQLWGNCDGETVTDHAFGEGLVVWGRSEREVLAQLAVPPDFEYRADSEDASLDYIHRTAEGAEIYFCVNRLDRTVRATCTFRVGQRQPELWDPISGEIREARAFTQTDGRTTIPLELAPHGSLFVVFRRPIAADARGVGGRNWPAYQELSRLTGPWTVCFDPKWGGPESVRFDQLVDWTKRTEPGIRYYLGAAIYKTTFDLPESPADGQRKLVLGLGVVKNVAEVRLNGQDLGVVWTAPWLVDISGVVRPTGNELDITVVNLWPNRLIGDTELPTAERFTKTNVSSFRRGDKASFGADSPLLPSGLLGPVTLQAVDLPPTDDRGNAR